MIDFDFGTLMVGLLFIGAAVGAVLTISILALTGVI